MRVALAQLAPEPGDVPANLARLEEVVRGTPADLAVFPELYLSGYRIGDRFHRLALKEGDASTETLRRVSRENHIPILVGTPLASDERAGEVFNAALLVHPSGDLSVQRKRYLPTFGPFEEGVPFTATDSSAPVAVEGHSIGLEICYDTFFPEVSRDLALGGAELLIVLSASPVTSRRLFERLLPARAIENGLPVVFVNRVGVEDGIVFGGGSGAWDVRGEPIDGPPAHVKGLEAEESVTLVEVDLTESTRWRPFRPVLRDVAARPRPPAPAAGD
jgi:predicted amidohydrolase